MTLAVSRHRRSHRGAWIAVISGVVVVALVAGATVAYARWWGSDCPDSPVTVNVATSPDQFELVSALAEAWNQPDEAGADGRCGQVAVEPVPSSFMAVTLSPNWDTERDGSRPDVWMPDSSSWLAVASARPEVAGLLPPRPPSLASSPVVLAMQQPMAEALGWPAEELGWAGLLQGFSRGATWAEHGHPEWGALRLGFPDPTRSTAGQAGVVTVLDPDADGTVSDDELLAGLGFSQLLTDYAQDTDTLLRPYATGAEPAGGDNGAAEDPADGSAAAPAAADLPAGFPVLERDLAAYATAAAASESAVPLVPVYPAEGVLFADFPYVVLDAPWVDRPRQELADAFLAYLRGPQGQAAYAEAGFRDPEHIAAGAAGLSPARGFTDPVAVPVRTPGPEAFGELLGTWPALVRPNHVLIVVDTSGSMNDEVPGTDQTRLELLQASAIEGAGLLNNQSILGLWEFSSELTDTTPYRELVPMGPAGEELDGVDRRRAIIAAVEGLAADGPTGLYDTIHDAYQFMREQWLPDHQNMLVVITDGKDEFHDGRSLDQLLAELEEQVDPDRPLPVIAMAVGPEADAEALQQVTTVTGGRTVIARDDVSALQQVVLAFAGRIS